MMRFDRFTERAQDATQRALEILQRYGHTQIDTEHIMLALLEQPGGVISQILEKLNVHVEPVKDKLDADLAKAVLSIPATKGFEIGSGFAATRVRGSEHNDPFEFQEGQIRTSTNRSGGVQGGISNGMNIVLRVGFKPTATIAMMQKTVSREGKITEIRPGGRHDPCVLPRAVPIVEAMMAITLADHLLRQKALRIE